MSNCNIKSSATEAAAVVAPLLHSYLEARKLLGNVPEATFALWISKGLLVPVRIGPRRCFIRHEDVVRLAQVPGPLTQKAVL
jgi:hypothetical protein